MSFFYEGKTYKNLKQAVEAHGLNYKNVWQKLKSGKSKKEAFLSNAHEFEYEGKKYRSLKAAAEAFGLDHRTVWSRLKLGKTIDEAFSNKTLPNVGRSTPITINGKTFSAVSVAAREYGVSERTVHARLKRGFTPEQAVGLRSFKVGTEKAIDVGDQTFPSIAAAARHFGVPIYAVYNRLRAGRTLEEVFSDGELKKKSPLFLVIKIRGLKFSSLKDACEYFDINYQVARYRLRKNWTLEQIFELQSPPINNSKNAPKQIKFRGKVYNSAMALAKEFGVLEGNFQRRIKDGWSIEEALELNEHDYAAKPQGIIVAGQRFKSRNEAARHYGLNIGTVATRVNKQGWSINQALELVPPPAGFHTDFGAVYLITNKINSMQYVGITLRNPPKQRFEEHVWDSKNTKVLRIGSLAEAINRFGVEQFLFEVIDTAKTQKDLQDLEKYHILQHNSLIPNGYNLAKGGTLGRTPGLSFEVPSLGKKFKSIAEAARHFQIEAGTIFHRLNKGYSPEQCVGIERLNWSSPVWTEVKVDGMSFSTIKEAAAHFGQPANRVRNRIHRGWPIEKALKTSYVSRSKPVEINGVQYLSIRQAANKIGISHGSLTARLKSQRAKA
ncbi:GIY-YIG nuclease family protein [Paracoccaceae bacterium]|nr:GIY-YIG nuclease family protein [Paracoccaceae bacterium]